MADTENPKASTIPEPPKFNLDDLPAPPKLEDDNNQIDIPDIKHKEINIPAPPSETPSIDSKKEEIPKSVEKNIISASKEPGAPRTNPDVKLTALEDLIPTKPAEKKKGLFSFLRKKEKNSPVQTKPAVSEPVKFDMPKIEPISPKKDEAIPDPVPTFPKAQFVEIKTDIAEPKAMPDFAPPEHNFSFESKDWTKEGEDFIKDDEMENEGLAYLQTIEKTTPLTSVKGIGPKREKQLKKVGIKSAEHLALHTHKSLIKKLRMPESQAKQIIGHAEKITQIKKKIKKSKQKDENITEVIKKLEHEKKELEILQKEDLTDDKIVALEGHKEIIEVLHKLEKKRNELMEMEKRVAEKEKTLSGSKDTYKRDAEYIDNLKRRLDHDVRERTQYLLNMEKEYFQKAQELAKKQSDIELRNKSFSEKEQFLKDSDLITKKKLNELEDREITVSSKEKKLSQMMKGLERQDMLLKEKEEDLVKREEEYLKKLDILEHHEKIILKNLEEKRVSLSKKDKEIELRESRLHSQQRNVDKKSVAVEYAKNMIEDEKGKLVDDEFEEYLKEQLGRIGSSSPAKNSMDVMSNLRIPNLEDSAGTVFTLIDTCKAMLKSNRVGEAKMYYNQVRERYYSSNFRNPKEKEGVHNMLRSLYDEINLADIGRH
ncbi:MAG: hypothetical protein ABIJ34_09165 [archaeon]